MMATVVATVETFGVRREITFRTNRRESDLFSIVERIAKYGNRISHRIAWDKEV